MKPGRFMLDDYRDACKSSINFIFSYLLHCSYFMTTEAPGPHNLLRQVLMTYYYLLLVFSALSTRQSLFTLQLNEAYALDHGVYEQIQESYQMKKGLLKKHCIIMMVYCGGIISCLSFIHLDSWHSIYSQKLVIGSHEYNSRVSKLAWFYSIKETVETMILLSLFCLWRIRDWPWFYEFDVSENPRVDGLFPGYNNFDLNEFQPRREINLS